VKNNSNIEGKYERQGFLPFSRLCLEVNLNNKRRLAMGFSLNEAINKRIIESIMAISKFFIDDCPDDYVLRIEIRRASKPVEPEAPDERIYLVIGEVHPALLRPDYKFIRTMEELKKSIEFAWNANELHDLPRMDIFSHDIFYLVQYHLEDDKAVIRVDSGSIIWEEVHRGKLPWLR